MHACMHAYIHVFMYLHKYILEVIMRMKSKGIPSLPQEWEYKTKNYANGIEMKRLRLGILSLGGNSSS